MEDDRGEVRTFVTRNGVSVIVACGSHIFLCDNFAKSVLLLALASPFFYLCMLTCMILTNREGLYGCN